MGRHRPAGGDLNMADDISNKPHTDSFATSLSHLGRPHRGTRCFVNPSVTRGSTVLYPSMAERRAAAKQRLDQALIYGTMGNPTHFALEDMVAAIEGGTRCQIVSTGLAAITVPLMAYTKTGDHMLMPDNVYGPARNFASGILARFGVETTFYDPMIDEAGIAALIRDNTTIVYTESPGSHTFEVQDVPAIARAAHARGATVMMDNTWGIHFFQPFQHGVDVSIQALTKYVGGHSDILLGAITTNGTADWERLRVTASNLGQYASPDDCWLALRGARTLAVRLEHQMKSGLKVATWLSERPEIARVLHPALPSCPGHEIWKRDFTGACSLFGVVFAPDVSLEASHVFAESLRLFGIGASWGGFESLALPTSGNITRTAGSGAFGGPMVRLHVGLEDPGDLIEDLASALAAMRTI
jgi:cysteine-S-conjugate beta-lyase